MEVNPTGDYQSSEPPHVTLKPTSYATYHGHGHPSSSSSGTQPNQDHARYSDRDSQQQPHQQQQPQQHPHENRNGRYQPQEYQLSEKDSRTQISVQDHHNQQYQMRVKPVERDLYPAHQPHSQGHEYTQAKDHNHVNGDSGSNDISHVDRVYDKDSERHGPSNEHGLGSSGINSASHTSHHPRIRSAPHSFHSHPSGQSSTSNYSATVSHHPNALNRYPFSIPSISAKLDQPPPDDGSDALSSLWKKTTPIQEPYFRTPYTIASQHTLSTLGG
ncbi:hypothetical protein BGX20_001639, partial [Mortierella sp. AD010]